MIMDQASTLRQLVGSDAAKEQSNTKKKKRRVRVISITSGKGGVGKTNITINLAYALSSLGRRVFILDADLGLANIDVLLNISPPYNIEHVLSGEKNINDIIVNGPANIRILPASSGLSELAELSRDEQVKLFRKLGEIDQTMDYLLVDTGAGIASNVLRFNATADEIILVATPEPTSMTDAYSVIKILATKYHVRKFNLITNAVESRKEAQAVFERLHKVVHDFLQININYVGFVFKDPMLTKAVRMQKPLLEVFPKSPAGKCFYALAQQIEKDATTLPSLDVKGSAPNFWDRLLHWKRQK
ncbi:MAG: MinD/ParA family protein [SAR324 cluster bacterium]|nr:MinD/ParA family protein [SAR324 cluster bacterium]